MSTNSTCQEKKADASRDPGGRGVVSQMSKAKSQKQMNADADKGTEIQRLATEEADESPGHNMQVFPTVGLIQ